MPGPSQARRNYDAGRGRNTNYGAPNPYGPGAAYGGGPTAAPGTPGYSSSGVPNGNPYHQPNYSGGSPAPTDNQQQEQYLKAVYQQQQRVAKLQADAKRYAALYLQRAQALEQASKGLYNNNIQRTSAYYGIDTSTPKGKAQAKVIAKRLRDLATHSFVKPNGDTTGAQQLVTFEEQSRGAITKQRNDQLAQAQANVKQAQSDQDWTNPSAWLHNGLRGIGAVAGGIAWPVNHLVEPAAGFVAGTAADVYHNALNAFEQVGKYGPRGNPDAIRAATGGAGGGTGSGGLLPGTLHIAQPTTDKSNGLLSNDELNAALQQYRNDIVNGVSGKELITRAGVTSNALNLQTIGGLALDIGLDPLTYALPRVDALKNLGNVATAGGVLKTLAGSGRDLQIATKVANRAKYIVETRIGRDTVTSTAARVRDAQSADEAARILGKDVPRDVVNDIFQAGKDGGKDAAEGVLQTAFAHGVWNPETKLVNQVAHGLGISHDILPDTSLSSLSRSLTEVAGRRIRQSTEFGAIRAPLSHAGTDAIVDEAIGLAADSNREWAGDLVKRFANGAGGLGGSAASGRDAASRAAYLVADASDSGDAAFQAVVADATEPLNNTLFEDMTKPVQKLISDRLDKLETIQRVLKGEAGPKAQGYVEDALRRQYSLPSVRTATAAVAKAVKSRAGQEVLTGSAYKKIDQETAQAVLDDLPDSSLKDALGEEFGAAEVGSSRYGTVLAAMDRVASNPGVLEDATRAFDILGKREAMQAMLRDAALHDVPAGSRLFRGASKVMLSFLEKRPLDVLRTFSSPFKGVNEAAITDYFDRYSSTLGLSFLERKALNREALEVAQEVARGASSEKAINLYHKMVQLGFEKAGLPREVAEDFFETSYRNAKNVQAFGLDDAHALVTRPQIASQAQTTFFLKNPDDLMDAIRDELAARGDHWAQARVVWDAAANKTRMTILGKEFSIAGGLREAEKFWKVMITTRAYAPLIGFTAGVVKGVSDGDDLWDSVQQGAQGAAAGSIVGAVGVLRYMERNWIQSRISSMLFHGMTPEEYIPGLSRLEMHFQNPVYGAGANYLSPSYSEGFFVNAGLSRTATDTWEVLVRTPKNLREFAGEYSRIINAQVNPETDEMMHLVLQKRAGQLTDAQFKATVKEWLKTDAGRDWQNKMAGVGIKKGTTAVARYNEWVNRYVSEDMARMRLAPEAFGPGKSIDLGTLIKNDTLLPEAIHRQATDSVFKKGIPNGMFNFWKNATERAAYDAPAMTGTKRAFYNAETKRLERSFIASGIDADKAVEYAGELATRHTNEVMFRVENSSRFAKKIDFISPFQGHREFNAKTWLRLASERPGHTALYGLNAAKAFNAGTHSGIFQKDPFSGQWQMSVPGSGPLSRALFGGPSIDFKVNLAGLLALTEGGLSPDGDTNNAWANALTSPLPRPGGPFWSLAVGEFAKHYPSVAQDMPPGLRTLVFGPVGPSTSVFPADTDRLWQAIAGTNPPWNFINEDEQKNDTARWELEVGKQLIAEHRQADIAAGRPVDMNWLPDDNAVHSGVKTFFLAWGFMRGIMPASPYPTFRSEAEFNDLYDQYLTRESAGSGMTPEQYKEAHYSELKQGFIHTHPAFSPYFDATTKYIGPDSQRHWEAGFTGVENSSLEKQLGLRREVRWGEYKRTFAEQNRQAQGYQSLQDAINFQGSRYSREEKMVQWRQAYPELAAHLHTKYQAEKELAIIDRTYPQGQVREAALSRWRHMYADKGKGSITKGQYTAMLADVRKKNGQVQNPFEEARPSEVVFKEVQKATGGIAPNNLKTIAYVRSHLSPAEQINYWTQAVIHLSYVTGGNEDAYKTTVAYSVYTNEIRQQYSNPAMQNYLRSDKTVAKNQNDDYGKIISQWHSDHSTLVFNLMTEAKTASTNSEAAYQRKDYANSKLLSQRSKALYAQVAAVRNADWHGIKDETWMHNQARELAYFHDIGATSDAEYALKLERANQHDKFHVRFIPSNEQAHFLAMPVDVRSAYIDNIVHNLSIPPGESKDRYAINDANPDHNIFAVDNEGVPLKMYWSYLTDFQKGQLSKFVPPAMVEGWKSQDPSMEKGNGKGGFHSGGFRRGHGGASDALGFAYSLMRQYNKRGNMKAPAGYKDYLALPNNPAMRNDFLDKHPDVAAYISAGPMHNMPPFYQMMVQQIMIQNGKWDGELQDPTGLADLAFAKTQLQLFDKRGDKQAPSTYDLWVNMPSGQAKAQYLTAHPEIGQWLQLGPMANMPEAYREVVRDIMLRYHQWSATNDGGLGPTIQGYYSTPSWARQQYLQDHPELVVYWQATQSPEDAAMSNLTNQFYSIADPSARQTFLASHPELQQHLVDARTKRYETFLNQVATYLGQSPDLFEHYLDDQTKVLQDLLTKFAQPALAGETHWMAPPKASTKSTESGRARQ